ncbi:MAG: alpha/beta hydrolase [Neorhizobium sp.]|nr:alpha/beta hydrolase [Neorhizobium sp.]
MSTVDCIAATVLSLLLAVSPVSAAPLPPPTPSPTSSPVALRFDGPIKPFKDDLFSRETVLESADRGAYKVIDYQEMRDINGRDAVPERHVKDQYMALGVRREQANQTLPFSSGRLDVGRVGPEKGATVTVIFIHGRGGDRRLGLNDYMFGGNFNRLKNLLVQSGGTYYSPSVKSFDDAGMAAVGDLIRYSFEQSSGGPVILACASMGGYICQGAARNGELSRYLKGMVYLGGPPDKDIAKTAFGKLKLPIYFAHGSSDIVYKWEDQAAVYRKLKAQKYPVMFTLFKTGTHGTPIRMVDWREALNFILSTR